MKEKLFFLIEAHFRYKENCKPLGGVVQPLLIGDLKCTMLFSLLVARVGSKHNYDFAAASPKENKQARRLTYYIATRKECALAYCTYARKKKP